MGTITSECARAGALVVVAVVASIALTFGGAAAAATTAAATAAATTTATAAAAMGPVVTVTRDGGLLACFLQEIGVTEEREGVGQCVCPSCGGKGT